MQGKYFIVSSKYGYDVEKARNKATAKIKIRRAGWLPDFDVVEEFRTRYEADKICYWLNAIREDNRVNYKTFKLMEDPRIEEHIHNSIKIMCATLEQENKKEGD